MATSNHTAPVPHYNPHPPPGWNRRNVIQTIVCGIIFCAFAIPALVCAVKFQKKDKPTSEFHVSALNVSNFNITQNNNISANWTLSFFVKNTKNDERGSYEQINAFISYQNTTLSSTSIIPFYQDEKDRRFLNVSLETHALQVETSVAGEIVLGWNMGVVKFGIYVNGTLRINARFEGDRQNFHVSCDDVVVEVSSKATETGALVGGSRECKLKKKKKN